MSKNITIKEGAVAKNFTGVKKLSTNQMGGGSVSWIPEDEAVDYVRLKKITARQNGTYTAEDESCDGFSEVKVDIPSDVKDKVITTNGEYLAAEDNCVGYRKVTVNVSGGGSGSGQHNVFFYAADRTTILEKVVAEDGGGAVYHGAQPTSSGMRFVGWTPNPVNIRADTNCYPRFENLIYDPTQIQDDWLTIARNVRQNPDAYKIGQWKLLECAATPAADGFSAYPAMRYKMQLVAKGVDRLEGENGYAPTTWLAMDPYTEPHFDPPIYIMYDNMEQGIFSWKGGPARKYLQTLFTQYAFPQDLLNYVRRVIKKTTHWTSYSPAQYDTDDPTIEWFFLPSCYELFGACLDYPNMGIEGFYFGESSGAVYDIFARNAQGQIDTYANSAVSRTGTAAFYTRSVCFPPGMGFGSIPIIVWENGLAQANWYHGDSNAFRLGFCL